MVKTTEFIDCKCESCGQKFQGEKKTYVKGEYGPKIFIDEFCPQCVLAKKAKEEEEGRLAQAEHEAQEKINSLKRLGVTDLNNTFNKMRHPGGFDKVFDAFKNLADGSSNYYMLLVYGGTGNGKTKCCEATVMALYDRGIYCQRQRWSEIVRHLKELMAQNGYEEYFNGLREWPYLIIDDVGSGSTGGPWEWGEIEDIVDYRLEQGLMTIITTNLDGKDIPERIISRFKDKRKARLVFNEVPDQRPLEK